MNDLVRVGEGYYTAMNGVPSEHRRAVRKVLRQMRKLTHRLVLNGEGGGEPTSQGSGEREETSRPALRRVPILSGQRVPVK